MAERAPKVRATEPARADRPDTDQVRSSRGRGAAAELLRLQASAGNRAVNTLLAEAQAKLVVGDAGDEAERQADRVADDVVAHLAGEPDQPVRRPAGAKVTSVRRRASAGKAQGGPVDDATEAEIDAARGAGRPLPVRAKRDMEQAFGASFSGVRVHSGPGPKALNERLGAKAFTLGDDIFFRGSVPAGSTPAEQGLLAHELAHTLQQGSAPTVRRLTDVVLDDTEEKEEETDEHGGTSSATEVEPSPDTDEAKEDESAEGGEADTDLGETGGAEGLMTSRADGDDDAGTTTTGEKPKKRRSSKHSSKDESKDSSRHRSKKTSTESGDTSGSTRKHRSRKKKSSSGDTTSGSTGTTTPDTTTPDATKPDAKTVDPSTSGGPSPEVEKNPPKTEVSSTTKATTPSTTSSPEGTGPGATTSKPDAVVRPVANTLANLKGFYGNAVPAARRIIEEGREWRRRRKSATAKRDEAKAALGRGEAVWDLEAATSGLTAATEAAAAKAAAAAARADAKRAAQYVVGVKQDGQALAADEVNRLKYRGIVDSWNRQPKGASPLTDAAVAEADKLVNEWTDKAAKALNVIPTADAKVKQVADLAAEAEADAKAALAPLQLVADAVPWKVVGILQQKLNATRPGGAARMRITGLFSADTKAALKAYQTAKALTVSGVADVATWNALDADAPSITENGKLTVKGPGEAPGIQPTNAGIRRPEVSFMASGPAVTELQQRLLNWNNDPAHGAKKPFSAFTADGTFGLKTSKALKAFQKAKGLKVTAVADAPTWAALDLVPGGASVGTQIFDMRAEVEGVRVGGEARYHWEIKGDKIIITVPMALSGESNHPQVKVWFDDIREIWNDYKAVEQGVAAPRQLDIEFNPVKSSDGHKIKIKKPTKANPNPRTDAANWYVNDNRRGLAPHEFGHLIGLEDEYNRTEEHYATLTGEEPDSGKLTWTHNGRTYDDAATEIHDSLVASKDETGVERLRKLRAVIEPMGLAQGGAAREIEASYARLFPFPAGCTSLARLFALVGNGVWNADLTYCTKVFLVSNTSIMGTMGSTGDRTKDLKALPPHEHPVQPRHIRHFAELATMKFPGTTWKPARR